MLLWLDAADFAERGQWKFDTQFTHLMGSPYLLACHTPGQPVRDAVAQAGWTGGKIARVWVRTKNWLYPASPGLFTVCVNGQESRVLGDMPTHEWYWHLAGDFALEERRVTLTLCDQTGYFGRCAAVLLSDDMDFVPPRPVAEYEQLRARCKGVDLTCKDYGEYDVLVAGAGPGGVPAAIAAARNGAKTLLLSGRPVIGGNASSEAGVGFNGASSRQVNAREGGIGEEIVRRNAHQKKRWQGVLEELCAAEPNLTVVCGYFVCGAQKNGGAIESVTARSILDNARIRIRARQFIDCTGDGWLGYHAGAKFRLGREAAWQYGEEFAPETADSLTMSGCTMNGYGRPEIQPMYAHLDHEVRYTAPDWVPKFPAGRAYGRNIERVGMMWWLEAPNSYDDIYDAEMARDELMRIHLGHYNYLKNLWDEKEKAKNAFFQYMPYYDAKRESRRFVGDYVLTQNDCMQGRDFPDTVAHAGWPIDLHNPKGIYSGLEGPFFSNTHIPLTKIPYRCLYSANVDNLQFAGRCASVSHIALGTTRVQNTIACEAQAVGTAAALCVRYAIGPRALGQTRLDEFRQLLLKADQYIPGLISTDELDFARKATAQATSEKAGEPYPDFIGQELEGYELDRQRATFFARGVPDDVGSVWTKLENRADAPAEVTFHIRLQADPDGYVTEEDARVYTVIVPARTEDWFEIPINLNTKLRYLWMWTDRNPGVWWHIWRAPALDWTRSERETEGESFSNIRFETHCVRIEAPRPAVADCSAKNVINGYSRANSPEAYEWVSDPEAGLPQSLTLTWPAPISFDTVYLTFDTDMTNPALLSPYEPEPHTLVTEYRLEALVGDAWTELAHETDNFLRRRTHTFPAISAKKLRVCVLDAIDHHTARMYEIRVYRERS